MKRFVQIVFVVLIVAPGCGRSKETPKPAARPAQEDVKTCASPGKIFGWRGDGTGRFIDVDAPIRWSEDKKLGILWQTEVGMSLSSPVVAGDRVFLTAEEDQLICVGRKDGRVLWNKDNGFATLPPEMKVKEKRRPSSCGFATPTPVTDGRHVYASYGTGIVVCRDLVGKRKWVRYFDLPPMTKYGRSASPVLAGGKLIISISRLIALDPATGKTLWDAKDTQTSYYGTPVVAKIGGVEVLVTPNGYVVRVSDGNVLAKEIGEVEYNNPVVADDVVVFASTTSRAVRLSKETGGKIRTEELWETELEGMFFSSPVWDDGIVYLVSNEGVLFALDAKKGKIVWQKELPIPSQGGMMGEPANIYASLAIAGKHLYLTNDIGDTLVLKPGREYKEVAQNELDDGSGASPVFDGKHLFLRGGTELYCIGKE